MGGDTLICKNLIPFFRVAFRALVFGVKELVPVARAAFELRLLERLEVLLFV